MQWSQIYQNYKDIIPNYIIFDEVEDGVSDNELKDEIFDINGDLHEWMIFTQIRPGKLIEEAILGLRELDSTFNWSSTFLIYQQPNRLCNFIREHQITHQIKIIYIFLLLLYQLNKKKC